MVGRKLELYFFKVYILLTLLPKISFIPLIYGYVPLSIDKSVSSSEEDNNPE